MEDSDSTQLQTPERPALKDLGSFDVEPTYAYLWDRCVYELLYNAERYAHELCEALRKQGIGKASEILDTSAGSGFPALDMYKMGYQNMTCVDASDDQIELFNAKAQKQGFDVRSEKCSWQNLPQRFQEGQFNALICKGSVWYAEGGWNSDFVPHRENAIQALKDTLTIFHSLLAAGGVLYLDKFKDDELDHKDAVGTFSVGGKQKALMFYTHRDKSVGIRRAKMIVKDIETGSEEGTPNVTYDLKGEELEGVLREVGFSFERLHLSEEKTFSAWLAVKK